MVEEKEWFYCNGICYFYGEKVQIDPKKNFALSQKILIL